MIKRLTIGFRLFSYTTASRASRPADIQTSSTRKPKGFFVCSIYVRTKQSTKSKLASNVGDGKTGPKRTPVQYRTRRWRSTSTKTALIIPYSNKLCMYICVRACVRVCVCVRACVCVYVCMYVIDVDSTSALPRNARQALREKQKSTTCASSTGTKKTKDVCICAWVTEGGMRRIYSWCSLQYLTNYFTISWEANQWHHQILLSSGSWNGVRSWRGYYISAGPLFFTGYFLQEHYFESKW